MSWVREDDRELLDPRIGQLSGDEYRELHALRQYVAREHPGAAGIFSRRELGSMAYATKRGARSVSPKSLARFLDLDLVRRVGSYSEAELHELETGEKTNRRVAYAEAAAAIRDAQTEDVELLRCNRWEHYNGGSDRTQAERKRRQRQRLRGDLDLERPGTSTRDGTRDGTGTVTLPTRARLPVPSRTSSTPTSTEDVEVEDLDFGEPRSLGSDIAAAPLDATHELEVARLLAAVGALEPVQADALAGYARRAPEAVLARVRETLTAGGARDRYAYALGALRREAGGS